ncbi:MAG: PEP-CTERM sorting domain-containing protein, partial [Syntrophobacteraceae bacterium]
VQMRKKMFLGVLVVIGMLAISLPSMADPSDPYLTETLETGIPWEQAGFASGLDPKTGVSTLEYEFTNAAFPTSTFVQGFWEIKDPAGQVTEIVDFEVQNGYATAFIYSSHYPGLAGLPTIPGGANVFIGDPLSPSTWVSALYIPTAGQPGYDSAGTYQQNGVPYGYEVQSDPIPEPCSMLLLGSGLVGLGVFRKRFKKS